MMLKYTYVDWDMSMRWIMLDSIIDILMVRVRGLCRQLEVSFGHCHDIKLGMMHL